MAQRSGLLRGRTKRLQPPDPLVLPNLIIPGAGKSGTTSLHQYLDQHPEVSMSQVKEPHFFSDSERYRRGLSWYADHFVSTGTSRVRGESSTTYFNFPNVIERIHENLRDVLFIVILRNPIDRVESHYRWLTSQGLEQRPFRAAFLADFEDEPDFKSSVGGNFFYYADESRYGRHVGRFIDAFGHSRILVVTTEELRMSPVQTLARCAEFLSLSPFPTLRPVWANSTAAQQPVASGRRWNIRRTMRLQRGYARSRSRQRPHPRQANAGISPDDRAWLREIFMPEVVQLRERAQRPFDEWGADFPPDVVSNSSIGPWSRF